MFLNNSVATMVYNDKTLHPGNANYISAFLQFVHFGASVEFELYFERNEACRNVATALRKAGFDVDSIKQLLQRKFVIVPMLDDGLQISAIDPKWPDFELAVYEGLKSSIFPGMRPGRLIHKIVNEQLKKMVDYGKQARAANEILQCGKILKKIVPPVIKAPQFTAYLQSCIDEERDLFVEARVIKMKSANFATWLWTQYADAVKDCFSGAEENAEEKFIAKLKEEEIDGEFYFTMDVTTLYESFQEMFKMYGETSKIKFLAALLSRDSTYWKDLYNLVQYATLFLREDMAYLPFLTKVHKHL